MRWPADLLPWLTLIASILSIAERVFGLAKEAIQMKRASKEDERPKSDEESREE